MLREPNAFVVVTVNGCQAHSHVCHARPTPLPYPINLTVYAMSDTQTTTKTESVTYFVMLTKYGQILNVSVNRGTLTILMESAHSVLPAHSLAPTILNAFALEIINGLEALSLVFHARQMLLLLPINPTVNAMSDLLITIKMESVM